LTEENSKLYSSINDLERKIKEEELKQTKEEIFEGINSHSLFSHFKSVLEGN